MVVVTLCVGLLARGFMPNPIAIMVGKIAFISSFFALIGVLITAAVMFAQEGTSTTEVAMGVGSMILIIVFLLSMFLVVMLV
ncbi:MAG: hypothetical protein IJ019_06645 [Alphaproteobacteria bacterium]|nr:hypothetical protein [Alphaproteobacteria bacterium]